MLSRLIPLTTVLIGVSTVLAESQATCALDKKCPKESPCCSQYGQCGAGAYCLGGCDPRMSFSLDSCVPAPVCASKTYKMGSTDGIVDVSKYLGDPTTADWVVQGTPLPHKDNLLLTMPPKTAGTVMASTVYMWYGTVKARMKSSRGAGVVTAFILLSDVKDEIDFEWVGTELGVSQTNYYFQGIPDYTHSANISSPDTFGSFHDYEIRWTPDDITWMVDGKVGRVHKKSETWNATANQWNFPQTPSRVQLSIWPGGAAGNAAGTINWAGGPIDWNSEDIKEFGYDYATLAEVSIECYQTSRPPGTNSGKSYTFSDVRATNDTVVNGDRPTVLKSLLGSGLNTNKVVSSAEASGTAAAVIPGLSGGGPGTNGEAAGDANVDSNVAVGSATTAVSSAAVCEATAGFSQDCGNVQGTSNEGARQGQAWGLGALAAMVLASATVWL